MPRSLSIVTDLVDASVFTALVRLCEYESTACPSMFVIAYLPPMKKVLYIYICVGIYSCDDVALGHLIRERRLLVKLCSKLGQVLFVPGHPWCRCILVLIAGCVHSFKEFLHSVVVRRGHKSRHCTNRSLMFCHSATSCKPPPPRTLGGPHKRLLDHQVRAKASPLLIGAPNHVTSIGEFLEHSSVVRF